MKQFWPCLLYGLPIIRLGLIGGICGCQQQKNKITTLAATDIFRIKDTIDNNKLSVFKYYNIK